MAFIAAIKSVAEKVPRASLFAIWQFQITIIRYLYVHHPVASRRMMNEKLVPLRVTGHEANNLPKILYILTEINLFCNMFASMLQLNIRRVF